MSAKSFLPPSLHPMMLLQHQMLFRCRFCMRCSWRAGMAHLGPTLPILSFPSLSSRKSNKLMFRLSGEVRYGRYYGDLPLALPHCGPACPGGLPALAPESPLLHLPPAIRGGKPLPLILGNSCFSRPFLPSTVFSSTPCPFEPKWPWINFSCLHLQHPFAFLVLSTHTTISYGYIVPKLQ